MEHNLIVTRDEWLTARKALLAKEKEATRALDTLSAERRKLPWVKVEKNYAFDGPNGKETLADLFDGRSQLIVYHFMFGSGWKEGCVGCSFLADNIDGALVHLEHHDVTYVLKVDRMNDALTQPAVMGAVQRPVVAESPFVFLAGPFDAVGARPTPTPAPA